MFGQRLYVSRRYELRLLERRECVAIRSRISPTRPATTTIAALDEAGRPTQKYARFATRSRACAAWNLGPFPRRRARSSSRRSSWTRSLRWTVCLPVAVACDVPRRDGSVSAKVWATFSIARRLRRPAPAISSSSGCATIAVVLLDGEVAGRLDRRLGQTALALPRRGRGCGSTFSWRTAAASTTGPNCSTNARVSAPCAGRGRELRDWHACRVAARRSRAAALRAAPPHAPGFWRGMFEVDEPADTFIDVRSLGKGALWINGRNAGRFWNVGPQRRCTFPACGCGKARTRRLHSTSSIPSAALCGRRDQMWIATSVKALVLGGGGAFGAYEAGVATALLQRERYDLRMRRLDRCDQRGARLPPETTTRWNASGTTCFPNARRSSSRTSRACAACSSASDRSGMAARGRTR